MRTLPLTTISVFVVSDNLAVVCVPDARFSVVCLLSRYVQASVGSISLRGGGGGSRRMLSSGLSTSFQDAETSWWWLLLQVGPRLPGLWKIVHTLVLARTLVHVLRLMTTCLPCKCHGLVSRRKVLSLSYFVELLCRPCFTSPVIPKRWQRFCWIAYPSLS